MAVQTVHTEKQLSQELLFEGRVITVTRDTVLLENGRQSTREVVRHNGGACVAALTGDRQLYFVRQFRYAYGRELLELPAGKLEKGEDPRPAALRELEEEVGVTAAELVELGPFLPTCGYCNEVIHLYAARGLTRTAQRLDEDEFVTVLTLPFEEAWQMAQQGRINDGKTIAALFRLKGLGWV